MLCYPDAILTITKSREDEFSGTGGKDHISYMEFVSRFQLQICMISNYSIK